MNDDSTALPNTAPTTSLIPKNEVEFVSASKVLEEIITILRKAKDDNERVRIILAAIAFFGFREDISDEVS